MTFQIKLFLAAISAALLALVVAGGLVTVSMRARTDARIEETLVAEARLAAELLGRGAATPAPGAPEDVAALDGEADRMGTLLGARVTFIAADGRVLGDSDETLAGIAAMENHASRPEVIAARESGIGRARRASATLKIDMLYVAVPVAHPAIAFVRVALPLADVRGQLRPVLTATLTALGLALIAAAAIAIAVSGRLGQRVRAIAAVADRYRHGDLTPPHTDYGEDELGAVARTLDDSVQELGRRIAELARDRARMEAILAGMIEGVIVVDPQGRLQLVNDAARRMLTLGELGVGRPDAETIRHPVIAELLSAALGGRTPGSLELTPTAGGPRAIMARAAPATSGSPHGAVVVLHDITELRRVDEIRRDFVANVSHELRTPLTAIRGYVEALLEGDTSEDEGRRFLGIIERHTLRMERLVKDLLRLARIEAGQEVLDLAPCDTRALIQTVATDLGSVLDARDQRLEIAVAPGAETVTADPAKLHDVLRNLIANAGSYGPEHSAIRVDAGPTVGATGAPRIAIAVSDQGPGIPEQDVSRIFERFYRVDKSRARDPGGTGLGLAIVKHLVELHGGQVKAANQPGGGACFTIELPGALPGAAPGGPRQPS